MLRRALMAAVVLLPAPARAYVRAVTPSGAAWHWDRPQLTLEVYAGEPGPQLTSDELVRAVSGAAAPWSQPQLTCTSVAITVEGVPEATAPVKRDGVNRVVFRRKEWCPDPRGPKEPCYLPQVLALTTDQVDQKTGRILEADIEVNAVNHVWSDLVVHPGAGAFDLQNALTHEVGHVIGFAHSCHLMTTEPEMVDDQGRPVVLCSEAGPDALTSTMVADIREGDLERRTLTDDDQRGVCEVYPRGIVRGATQGEAPSGGCEYGARVRPTHLVLVLVLVLRVRFVSPGRTSQGRRVRARVRVRAPDGTELDQMGTDLTPITAAPYPEPPPAGPAAAACPRGSRAAGAGPAL